VDRGPGARRDDPRVWDRAAVADRKALARALSDALVGLVVTEAGQLVAGRIIVVDRKSTTVAY